MLIQHSLREVRKPCADCGRTDLYQAHDTDNAGGNAIECPVSDPDTGRAVCSNPGTKGYLVLTEKNGHRHALVCSGLTYEQREENRLRAERRAAANSGSVEPSPAWEPTLTTIPVIPAWSPPATTSEPVTAAPGASADQVQQMFAMMAKLFGSQVDPETIRAMVREEADRIAHPVNTVVVNQATGSSVTVIGAHEQLAEVVGFLQDGHVYLVGPAGTGKSRLAFDATAALGLKFYSISLTQQTPVSSLAGYMNATGGYVRTSFRDAVEFGHPFLCDEIDHGHANTVGFVNGATSNDSIGFPDGMVDVHPDFRLIAAGNTFGQGQNSLHTGATKLDAATLNRFGKLEVGYDEALENSLVAATGLDSSSQRKVLEFVRRTRRNALKHPEFQFVASPRNSVRIARALMRGVIWDKAVEVHLMAGVSEDKRAKLYA